jgi:hypothetical protein
LLIGLAVLAVWLFVGGSHPDRLFRGKPESVWMRELKYWDDEQLKEWRGYGEAGVQVLIRGLENAQRPAERAYRKFSRKLPGWLSARLPTPKQDATRTTRHCIVSLLASLGTNATSATPLMIYTVCHDEADAVRQSAICFFTTSEDEHALINHLPPGQKQTLLVGLLDATKIDSLRNNAVLALRHYPENPKAVVPALLLGLKDPKPQVAVLAAKALLEIDATAVRSASATAILCSIANHPDDQIAFRAVSALGSPNCQTELAVPALVECLKSTNTLVACQAVWTLKWKPSGFIAYSNVIIPALESAAQRKDNVAGYARSALNSWRPPSRTK